MSDNSWDEIPLEEPPDDYGYSAPPPDWEEVSHDASYSNSQKRKPSGNSFFKTKTNQGARDALKSYDELLTELKVRILEDLRLVIASTHNQTPTSVIKLVERVMLSKKVFTRLDEELQEIYISIFEILNHEASVTEGSLLDIHNLHVASEYPLPVIVEIQEIIQNIDELQGDAHSKWQALVEHVQRFETRTAALALVYKIDAKSSTAELMVNFKKIEPPTTQKSITKQNVVKTAKVIVAEDTLASAGKAPMRFSSGMPTLDMGYTGKGELKGLIAPGQLIMVMGPTGTGKSSFCYGITPAMTQDLKNYGLPDAKHVVFHTEEESIDKIDAFRMKPDQPYYHLSDMVVVDAVGTSRQRIVTTLYDLVIDADKRARETKRSITDFLPYIIQLDYLQSIVEAGEDEKEATATTSELLLRGVCAWNPEEMDKFSGVNFREYAGMGWPEGMERHRVAVLAYAQLVKISADTEKYQEGKSKPSDFAVLDSDDQPCWELREGDLRIFSKGQMRGSGVVANNAHAIIILHRSVPSPNPVDHSQTEPDGTEHLTDIRARILFDKARSGNAIPYAPMEFDRQADGPKAQYFDVLAEAAIEKGVMKNYDKECYKGRGSMILPLRPVVNLIDSFKY